MEQNLEFQMDKPPVFVGSQKNEEQGVWNRLEEKMVELRGRLTLGQPCRRGLNSESRYWTES